MVPLKVLIFFLYKRRKIEIVLYCPVLDVNLYFVVSTDLFFFQVVQKEREEKLADILKNRLNQYVQGNKEDFVNQAEAEVARLSSAGTMS